MKIISKLNKGLVLVPLFWSLTAGAASAADIALCAGETTRVMPDTSVVAMWGFALGSGSAAGCDGVITVPGPRISVPPGDTILNVTLTNTLSVPVSVVIPGQVAALNPTWVDAIGNIVSVGSRLPGDVTSRVRSFTHETAAGTSEVYSWSNISPGTHIYHSGTHPAVQVQMGLYGAVTSDFAVSMAYDGVGYDNEVILYYSEIDPALHEAVSDGTYGTVMTSTIDFQPKFFLLNGEPYSNGPGVDVISGNTGETTLVRLLNMGLKSHIPMLVGSHMSVVAEDGNLYPFAKEHYAVLLAAGKTKDGLVNHSVDGNYSVMDRRLFADVPPPVNTCAADFNNDGSVDTGDFAIFFADWGRTDCSDAAPCTADFNNDGNVDTADFAVFFSEWGRTDCLAP